MLPKNNDVLIRSPWSHGCSRTSFWSRPGRQIHRKKPCRNGLATHSYISGEIQSLLDADVIEPAQSKWHTLVVCVPEQDGLPRFCVAFRKIITISLKDAYPLPRMDDFVDSLEKACIFSTIDANWRYWQIPVRVEVLDKTTLTYRAGTNRFKRRPFGLINAPATFHRSLKISPSRYRWQMLLLCLQNAPGSSLFCALWIYQ